MDSGQPFTIVTARGKEYRLPTREHIFISPKGTFVQVVDDDAHVYSIPLLTMTAVHYQGATRVTIRDTDSMIPREANLDGIDLPDVERLKNLAGV